MDTRWWSRSIRSVATGLWRRALAAAVVLLALAGFGCGRMVTSAGPGGEAAGQGSSALAGATPSDQILGFEQLAGWTVRGGVPTTTVVRTQGSLALEVDSSCFTAFDDGLGGSDRPSVVLLSAPLASTALALQGLSTPGAAFLVDVSLPAGIRPVARKGALQLFVSSRSAKVANAYLGRVSFDGQRVGTYRSYRFTIPEPVRAALAAAPFTDLVVRLRLSAPANAAGAYRFDNLRASAFGTPVPGPGQSLDLVSERSYQISPPTSTPGTATNTTPAGCAPTSATCRPAGGLAQIPQRFHVKLGSAGTTGTAQLVLGYAGPPATTLATCTYAAAQGGASYDLKACTDGFQAGDLVGADTAALTILSGVPDAATQLVKVRAQIAFNPVGDLAGAGIIPPMPTYWGENTGPTLLCQAPGCLPNTANLTNPLSPSQIVTDYFNLVKANPPIGSTVKTPRGEFARRPLPLPPPYSTATPPPPGDPDFDTSNHLCDGCVFDAYYRIWGHLSTTPNPAGDTHTDLAANLSANAVLLGNDVTVAGVGVDVFTDTGQMTTTGFTGQSSGGTLTLELLGASITPSVSFPTGGSFDLSPPPITSSFDLPPIPIWIFTITVGVQGEIGISASGNFDPVAFNATITPSASAGAHIEGDIDLGIASGGVSAIVDLLSVSTPVAANVALTVDTAPGPGHCTVGYRGDLNGTLELSSLGGEVDLEATFGVCPFCVSDSWTLVSWDGVSAPPVTLFDFPFGDAVPLNPALCEVSLVTTITQPPVTQKVTFGLPVTLSGAAYRPATAGQPLATAITDCSRFAWSTDNLSGPSPDVLGAVSGPDFFNNCSQQITFGNSGQPTRTITLTVTDQFGETGTASEVVNVAAPPAGPSVAIACPVPTYTCDQSGLCFTLPCVDILSFGDPSQVAAGPVSLTGTVFDADPTAVLAIDWTATPTGGGGPIDICQAFGCVVMPPSGAGFLSEVVAMAWLPPPAFGSYVVSLVATDSNGLSATDRMTYTFQPTVK